MNSRLTFSLSVATLLLSSALSSPTAHAAPSGPAGAQPTDKEVVLTLAAEGQNRRDLALALAPVRSAAQLAEHLRSNPGKKSPINLLSPLARQRFLESLTFGEKGVSGFYIGDLEAELTATEIHALLSLFGMQHNVGLFRNAKVRTSTDQAIINAMFSGGYDSLGEDHKDYRCESRGTCASFMRYICTSNC